MVRRSKIDVIWDMLIALQRAGGQMKPTRLLYKANLSYNKLKEYLSELEEQNFIELNTIEDDRKLIEITIKGHQYVSELRRVRNFGKDLGLND